MMNLKYLMQSTESISPDGQHWEPALPIMQLRTFKTRFTDAWAVWKGNAVAVRQTEKGE